MNKILPLLVLYVISFAGFSSTVSTTEKMLEVNAQWLNNRDGAAYLPAEKILCATFDDAIALHLRTVVQTLQQRSVAHLTAQQQFNRARLLQSLEVYAHLRLFPVNDFAPYKTPVFIDRAGRHCAVGYLMQQSGAADLAQRIAAYERLAYVHDIKTAGVAEWAASNGFTVDELAWIQPAYPVGSNTQAMDSGFNGNVYALTISTYDNELYAAGDFTQAVSGANCNRIAKWQNGIAGYDWMPLGNGVNGSVYALLTFGNKLVVGGNFPQGSSHSANIAAYNLMTGTWDSMGKLNGTVRALAIYKNELYAGGDFSGNVAKWNGQSWQTVPLAVPITGRVHCLEVWNNNLVIGGDFDIQTNAVRKYILGYDGTTTIFYGFGTPSPVRALAVLQGKLYAGCDFTLNTDSFGLLRYDSENMKWQNIRPEGSILASINGNAIYSLANSNERSLLIGGDFLCYSGMYSGQHFMRYFPEHMIGSTIHNDVFMPLVDFDKPVHTVAIQNSLIYFGGELTKTTSGMTGQGKKLNRIGYMQDVLSRIEEMYPENTPVNVYPLPATEQVYFEMRDGSPIEKVTLQNALGQIVMEQDFGTAKAAVSVAELPAQVYFATISLGTKKWSTRVLLSK